jgi:hypothetical protein
MESLQKYIGDNCYDKNKFRQGYYIPNKIRVEIRVLVYRFP